MRLSPGCRVHAPAWPQNNMNIGEYATLKYENMNYCCLWMQSQRRLTCSQLSLLSSTSGLISIVRVEKTTKAISRLVVVKAVVARRFLGAAVGVVVLGLVFPQLFLKGLFLPLA